jgi:hypothetical protein
VTGVNFRPEPLRGWHLAVCETSRAMPDHQVGRSRRGNTRVTVLKLEVNSTEVLTRPSAREGIRAMLRAPIRLPQCTRAQTCWLHSRLYLSTCRFQRRDQTLHSNPQGRHSYHRLFSKKTGLLTPDRSKTLKEHFTLNSNARPFNKSTTAYSPSTNSMRVMAPAPRTATPHDK